MINKLRIKESNQSDDICIYHNSKEIYNGPIIYDCYYAILTNAKHDKTFLDDIIEYIKEIGVSDVNYGDIKDVTTTFYELLSRDWLEHSYNNANLFGDCIGNTEWFMASELSCNESLSESFSNYDIEDCLCQIEDKWGLWLADKMLNWLIDHSDNAEDIFNEQGVYDVEQFEYWIGENAIEKVMKHCLETGKVEDIY